VRKRERERERGVKWLQQKIGDNKQNKLKKKPEQNMVEGGVGTKHSVRGTYVLSTEVWEFPLHCFIFDACLCV